jgi:hypothetical protein
MKKKHRLTSPLWILRCATLKGVERFLFIIIVASFGVPKYRTSILSTRPTFSLCFFCSKSKILFLLRRISSNERFPGCGRQTKYEKCARIFAEKLTFSGFHEASGMTAVELATQVDEKVCCHRGLTSILRCFLLLKVEKSSIELFL